MILNKVKIKSVNAAKYFTLLYNKHNAKRDGLDNFLRYAYLEIKKYENKFNK